MAKKVDLNLLKRLVSELESSLNMADTLLVNTEKTEYVVEMNKASGLATGVMTEAALLITDIQFLVQGGSVPAKSDTLDKVLGAFKFPGGKN